MTKSSKLEFDHIFMKLAIDISSRSHCIKKKVGAVITKDTRVISSGYNGPPSGTYNCDTKWPESGCPRSVKGGCSLALHAEQNAIIFAYKNNIDLNLSTLYVTLSPCLNCARLIFGAGIKKVIFLDYYSEYKSINIEEGISFLEEFGVEVNKFPALLYNIHS
ncbi:MAG: dCMP deaminase family protein [Bacteroidetes bacterium]|nr:dCMP deaminase family protein [Bacteroidota bacterium]